MKKAELRGVGTVFRFEVEQHYKMKSTIIFLIVMTVIALAIFPVIAIFSGGNKEVNETTITRLYIRNETDYPIDHADIQSDARYAAVECVDTDTALETFRQILWDEEKSAVAVITHEETGGFKIKGYYGEKGSISDSDIRTLCGVLEDAVHESLLRSANVTQAQLDTVKSRSFSQVARISDYFKGDQEQADMGTHVFINMFYSYAIMILSSLAMSYIFQVCMEEKVSKLVESLLVSVHPTALLLGKVLAASFCLAAGIALLIAALMISWKLGTAISGSDSILSFIQIHMDLGDFSSQGLHIGLGWGLLTLLCLVLAYANSAGYSGIFGSCCSKPEDTQHASLGVVLFLMVGFMCAAFAPLFQNDVLNIVFSLFPMTSIFTALPNFLCGKIHWAVFAAALVIQVISAFVLMRAAGAAYRMMILYRGDVPKPKQFLAMMREYRAASKAEKAGKEGSHEA
ncbi:MAG TPA: hypothetical protein DDX71_06855 [Ruminococcus sp.]|nr:hypothetical protein [Ruminococcus sp.]